MKMKRRDFLKNLGITAVGLCGIAGHKTAAKPGKFAAPSNSWGKFPALTEIIMIELEKYGNASSLLLHESLWKYSAWRYYVGGVLIYQTTHLFRDSFQICGPRGTRFIRIPRHIVARWEVKYYDSAASLR
jgi:hypothetical protein